MTKPSRLPAWVGSSLSKAEREHWREFVALLCEMSEPGGPLDGWLFHGTTSQRADGIMASGMEPTEVMLRIGGSFDYVGGSYWGRPLIAAGYAEDPERFEGHIENPISIVAIRLNDLSAECALAVDEPTLDFPVERLIGMTPEELEKKWAPRDPSADWLDSLEVLGSVAALHDDALSSERMLMFRRMNDIESFIAGANRKNSH